MALARLRRSARNVSWGTKRFFGRGPESVRFQGCDVSVDPDSAWAKRIYILGDQYLPAYEYEVMSEFLDEGSVALDVGSFIGTHMVAMAQRVGPSGRVYAFEPQPGCRDLVQRTIRENDLEQCTFIGAAVGDQNTHVKMQTGAGPTATSTLRTLDPWNHHTDALDVDMVRIDDFLTEQNIETVDFLKLDVQGAELEAVEGMKTRLGDIRAMQIEIHTKYIEEPEREIPELYEILASRGDLVRIDTPTREPVTRASALIFERKHPHVLWSRA